MAKPACFCVLLALKVEKPNGMDNHLWMDHISLISFKYFFDFCFENRSWGVNQCSNEGLLKKNVLVQRLPMTGVLAFPAPGKHAVSGERQRLPAIEAVWPGRRHGDLTCLQDLWVIFLWGSG